MSHFNAAAPAPEGSLPDATCADAMTCGPIYSAYPRMAVGFILIAVCWSMRMLAPHYSGQQRSSLQTVGLLAGFAGYIYWLFCIHRFHKILAEYTRNKYPIPAWKSVAFLFIPLFSVYWIFKWPARLANFVSSRPSADGTVRRMHWVLPATALLVASLSTSALAPWFGFEAGISLQLLLVFAVGMYFTRHLKRVLPGPEPISLRRLKQLKVSASAGVGAAFSLLLFEAIREFFSSNTLKTEREHDLLAIGLVSVGVMIFLEPLSERLRHLLAHDHPMLKSNKSWWLRLAVLGVLVVTSLLHGMAHTAVDNWMKHPDGPQKVMALAAAMLISGGITYFWIGASHLHTPHATFSGAFSGAVLAFVVLLGLASVASHRTAALSVGRSVGHHLALPGVPARVTQQIENGDLHIKALLVLAFPWLLMGLAGGTVFDRRWARHCCAANLALSIVGAGILSGLLLRFISPGWAETFAHLPAVGGWVVALILCCSPRTLGLEAGPAPSAHPSPSLAQAVAAS
jgi:hypothetical protein